ncbi:CDP-glycerol glycerophosphotransferase family protein [Alteribacter populi]|uniref:CDP-glycerol glycerophosphotransferase family protein n=1 Tax=Alteribacter populi TaxID=2011011 RepID=UPI000BBB10F7|nr:CDP-glycerol glycerophosphotransferase family protein [Alteribacter populi]
MTMQRKNQMIWLHSIDFLKLFSNITYDNVPITLPLLREFQKYVARHYKSARLEKKGTKLHSNIQKACEPYLIKSTVKRKEGYVLVRADLYPLTANIKNRKFLYLAHHRHEYKKMLKNEHCRPLIYLQSLPETAFLFSKEQRVLNKIKKVIKKSATPRFFKSKTFISWLNKKVKKLLSNIRKVNTLFEKYPISKTLYGSTINRHGALITTFAQTRNVQTINFQHGVFGEVAHLPVNADVNLVWGESHKKYLESYGVPADKIMIVPPLFPRSLQSRTPFHSISHQKKRVLVALQPLGYGFNKKMIQTIEKAAQPLANRLLIRYKLHPDQRKRRYSTLINPNYSTMYNHGSFSLHTLIEESDIVITPFSTVAYEALLLEKPVVFYSKKTTIYYLRGTPIFVKEFGEFKQLFSKISSEPTYLSTLVAMTKLKDEKSIPMNDKTVASFLI